MNAPRIVIVEDDLLVAQTIQRKLEQAGYVVPAILASGQEAIGAIPGIAPDLILMDIELDGSIDGIQASAEIHRQTDVPIIYLTAYANEDVLRRAKMTEPYGYILKPFRDRELLSNIEITLHRHRLERELRVREAELQIQALVLNQIQDRVTITDLDGTITYVNDAEVITLGRPREELIGQNISIYGEDPTRGASQQEILRETIQDGHWRGEVINYAADGHEVILDCRTQVIYDNQGRPIALCGVSTDITARRRAIARMRVMSEMLDVAPNSITVHDFDGTFLYANQKTFDLHQYTQDEFMALNLRDLDMPESAALIAQRMRQVIERGEASFQVNHRCRDSSIIPLEIFAKQVDWMGRPAILSIGTDTSERLQAERERDLLLAQIRAQAQQLRDVLNAVPEGVLLLDPDCCIVLANPAAQRDLALLTCAQVGERLDELGDIPLTSLLSWPQDPAWHEVKGKDKTFEAIGRPIHLEPNQIGWVLVLRDMTGEREMQARVRHQDRLAVIGQLAGGVAHDFNNLLTAIKGYNQFAIDELLPGDPILADLEEVKRAADHAAALTNQLLAFSRKQILQPRIISINDILAEMEKMLRRLIGENIQLTVKLDANLAPVLADPGQIEQVVMNLCVNARDAMPGGGQLTLSTHNVTLPSQDIERDPDTRPGPYVLLTVRDTGIGMTDEVKAHLFEPFFTTKEHGKGTGLGLSMVWGVIQQSGGQIQVESQAGAGTTFKIYLPQIEQMPAEHRAPVLRQDALQGSETLLLVEDEDVVRALAERALIRYGYNVLVARRPGQALALSEQYGDKIRLLITDVVMPEMSGRELAESLRTHLPHLRVLYISGYTDNAISALGVLTANTALLEKPFTLEELARRVRKVLDA